MQRFISPDLKNFCCHPSRHVVRLVKIEFWACRYFFSTPFLYFANYSLLWNIESFENNKSHWLQQTKNLFNPIFTCKGIVRKWKGTIYWILQIIATFSFQEWQHCLHTLWQIPLQNTSRRLCILSGLIKPKSNFLIGNDWRILKELSEPELAV